MRRVAFAIVAVVAGAAAANADPSPAPSAATAPAVAPTPGYRYVFRPSPSPDTTPFPGPNAPAIAEVDVNDAAIVTPGDLHVRVVTSDAVTTVTAQTLGRTVAIPRAAPGRFVLDATIGSVPDFLKNRSFDIEFVASVPDGRTANVTLPLTLR